MPPLNLPSPQSHGLFSQGQILATWGLGTKLPKVDMNIMVDLGVDSSSLSSHEKGPINPSENPL